MNGIDSTEADDFVEVGGPLARMRAVNHLHGMTVLVEWEDGREEPVDLRPAIVSHRSFACLRDNLAAFTAFQLRDRGDALVWPGGEELPAYWIAELAPVAMDNSELRQALIDLGFSADELAAELGISRRLLADYLQHKPIPRVVALATRYLVARSNKPS